MHRSRALFRTAYPLTGDRGLAEDLLQTALTKMYLAWGRIRAHESAGAYAKRTIVTTAASRSWPTGSTSRKRTWWLAEHLLPGE